MVNPPSEQNIFDFVASTHAIDRINLTADEVVGTWQQKRVPNPYAQGHFRAFMYIIHTLIGSSDFPAKAAGALENVRDSDAALFWLREIHRRMATPLVNHELLADDINAPTSLQVGRYRGFQTAAVDRPAPPPEAIPKIMHNWLIEYAEFHDKIKGKVDNPYGVDKELAIAIHEKATNVNLFFCIVQPMGCLNQRMGRFMENVFRLAWRLPMRYYTPNSDEYARLPKLLQAYQNRIPDLVTASRAVRG